MNDRLFDIAKGVAPLLDGYWRYNHLAEENDKHDWSKSAVLNDDTKPLRQITIKNCWDKKERAEIYGTLPGNHYSRIRITVAKRRDIPSIASDINRRFLPSFLKEWKAKQDDLNERQQKMTLYKHQVDLLSSFVPEFRQLYRNELSGSDEFVLKDGKIHIFANGYDASLELRLPFDELIRVLKFLYPEKK